MNEQQVQIDFTEDEVLEILKDYYGEIEEFYIDAWSKEEIKIAILNK